MSCSHVGMISPKYLGFQRGVRAGIRNPKICHSLNWARSSPFGGEMTPNHVKPHTEFSLLNSAGSLFCITWICRTWICIFRTRENLHRMLKFCQQLLLFESYWLEMRNFTDSRNGHGSSFLPLPTISAVEIYVLGVCGSVINYKTKGESLNRPSAQTMKYRITYER